MSTAKMLWSTFYDLCYKMVSSISMIVTNKKPINKPLRVPKSWSSHCYFLLCFNWTERFYMPLVWCFMSFLFVFFLMCMLCNWFKIFLMKAILSRDVNRLLWTFESTARKKCCFVGRVDRKNHWKWISAKFRAHFSSWGKFYWFK